MSDDLVKRLRDWSNNPNGRNPAMAPCDEAADRIEQLETRIQLLEGWLNGSLNIIEAFVVCDTQEARTALEEKKDE